MVRFRNYKRNAAEKEAYFVIIHEASAENEKVLYTLNTNRLFTCGSTVIPEFPEEDLRLVDLKPEDLLQEEVFMYQKPDESLLTGAIINYLGGGVEAKTTSLYFNGKKIFSFASFLDENAFENEKLNKKYSTTITYDNKTNSIIIVKKGKDAVKEVFRNGMKHFDIAPVNEISTYKFNGEFLEKITTKKYHQINY